MVIRPVTNIPGLKWRSRLGISTRTLTVRVCSSTTSPMWTTRPVWVSSPVAARLDHRLLADPDGRDVGLGDIKERPDGAEVGEAERHGGSVDQLALAHAAAR